MVNICKIAGNAGGMNSNGISGSLTEMAKDSYFGV
jgi:hypothetical protein